MRCRSLMLAAFFVLALSGCMVSEQMGEMPQDLVFHFDTQFNRVMVFGRSAILAVVALWVFNGWGKKAGGIVVGMALSLGALWLAYLDYPTLKDYRVEVLAQALRLNIPPELETEIAWSAIERLDLAGVEWAQGSTLPGQQTPAWAELPQWETMTISVAGGETHTVNLKRLSVEQRQILWRAIVKRGGLVEER